MGSCSFTGEPALLLLSCSSSIVKEQRRRETPRMLLPTDFDPFYSAIGWKFLTWVHTIDWLGKFFCLLFFSVDKVYSDSLGFRNTVLQELDPKSSEESNLMEVASQFFFNLF